MEWIRYNPQTRLIKLINLVRKVESKIIRKTLKIGLHHKLCAHLAARTIDPKLVAQCDYLFFPGGAEIEHYMSIHKPYICFSDSTSHLQIGYYWHNLSKRSIREAETLEEVACHNARLNIRPSQWAIRSVIEDCHVDPQHCYVIEFGANLDDKDIRPVQPYSEGTLKVLFSGVDWIRKGGRIAVDAIRLLRDRGIDAMLYIVGIRELPEEIKALDYVVNIGFLNKNNPLEYKQYVDIFHSRHVLLLPTLAECAGIVFSEAANFGMPVYTHLTGGSGSYVFNGVNGRALPLGSTGKYFADEMEQDIRSNALAQMSGMALQLAQEKLSWNAWSCRFKQIMEAEGLA